MAQNDIQGNTAPPPYKHEQESVQRPDIGVEEQFAHKKAPQRYRYDGTGHG